jgi:hypothetical protein
VQQRDPDGGLDLVGDLVHRVGADQQHVRAGGLESLGRLGKQLPGLVPPPGDLQQLHVGEVHRRQHNPSGVQTTEPLADKLVGKPVILRAGLPAHPTEHPDHPRRVHRHSDQPATRATTSRRTIP